MALRRSSSLGDHAAAGARLPVRARETMVTAVVLPRAALASGRKESWPLAKQLPLQDA